jgi:16S rRNA processing protein RimM
MEAKGLGGEIFILLFSKDSSWISNLSKFALATDDQGPFETYDVERAREQKAGFIVKSKGLIDRTAAEKKRGHFFYVTPEVLVSKKGDTIFLSEIKGFTVFDGDTEVGPIVSFSSNGPQDILIVDKGGREVSIPFVEVFIKSLDFSHRRVLMSLPEGLLEVDE